MDTELIEIQLQQKKIRPTAMRLLIYNILNRANRAISLTDIETIFQTNNDLEIPVDRTTIYRTVKTFEKKGVAHAIDQGNGVLKYALCQSNCEENHHRDRHLHFYCKRCEKTSCLTDQLIPKITLASGYEIHELNFVAKGICDQCG
jgi:Fur family ferric uptake transcriptional regulator